MKQTFVGGKEGWMVVILQAYSYAQFYNLLVDIVILELPNLIHEMLYIKFTHYYLLISDGDVASWVNMVLLKMIVVCLFWCYPIVLKEVVLSPIPSSLLWLLVV